LTTDVTLTAAYTTGAGATGLPFLDSQITLQGRGHTISRDGDAPASPAIDLFPDPEAGVGRYYLARGLDACMGAGYGQSSLDPDPRGDLNSGPCP